MAFRKKNQDISGPVRLNRFLAECGVASRRKADELITSGQVQVNGKTVYELGVRIEVGIDRVVFDGKVVKPSSQKIYVIFNKPENVMTTMSDPEGRPTVADFVEQLPVRVFPVGRLDWDTEGLLLLTNDGDFSQRVMHPKEEIAKTYLAKLDGKPTPEQLAKLLRGVTIPGGRVKAWHVETAKVGDSDKYGWVKIVIGEGKNRQVRHMFNKIGYDVKKLKRVAIGMLTLGNLDKGEYAFLDPLGIAKIFRQRPDDADLKKARTGPRASRKAPKFETKRAARSDESQSKVERKPSRFPKKSSGKPAARSAASRGSSDLDRSADSRRSSKPRRNAPVPKRNTRTR